MELVCLDVIEVNLRLVGGVTSDDTGGEFRLRVNRAWLFSWSPLYFCSRLGTCSRFFKVMVVEIAVFTLESCLGLGDRALVTVDCRDFFSTEVLCFLLVEGPLMHSLLLEGLLEIETHSARGTL